MFKKKDSIKKDNTPKLEEAYVGSEKARKGLLIFIIILILIIIGLAIFIANIK